MRSQKETYHFILKSKSTRVTGSIFLVGLASFSYVWWPIQSQRNLSSLKKLEAQISEKKAELNRLHSQYAALTSLPNLDQWAKAHGPWKTPRPDDIIAIE